MKRLPLSLLHFFTVFTLCITVFSAIASAQKPGFTLEQVMSSPFPTALTAAAKANRVAWVFDSKGERNVWVADAPEFTGRQITHYQGDDGQDIFAVTLTPDGKTVFYARGSEVSGEGHVANPASEIREPKQQVWAADVETGKPRLVGEMGCIEEDCEDIQISPDGQWVVWVGAKHRLWIACVSCDKTAHALTELRGEESEPQWSPDGRHIAFSTGRRDHGFVAVLDMSAEGTAERVRYVSPTVDRDFAPRWSPDGKELVFLRVPGAENHRPLIPKRPQPWAIWLAQVEGGSSQSGCAGGGASTPERATPARSGDPGACAPLLNISARELWHSGKEMNDSLPPFAAESLKFAEGGKVIFCSEQSGRNHLYLVYSETGKAHPLTPDTAYDVEDVSLAPDNKTLLYTSNAGDPERRHITEARLESFNPAEKLEMVSWQFYLTWGKTAEWHPLMLADGKTVLCLGSSAVSPAMPYRLTGKGGREMIAASALPKDFPSAQLVEPQTVTFRSEDGVEVHGQLFVPRGRTQPGPALIFVHGGPPRQMMPAFHYMYYYHNSYAENQYLASLGYVVLSVNYRLGVMYGRAFREAENAGWRGSSEYKDVVAGGKFLESLPYVDRKRIGIWGGSYGGLLTALALARNSDIFAAGVDFHGVHDWSVLLGSRLGEDAPDYKEAQKLAFDSSPVASVAGWRSPVLLIHGDDDRNVPFSQTTDLAQRLRRQNVEFEQMILPDEIHDFLLWRSWVKGYKATAEFFDRKLKGSP